MGIQVVLYNGFNIGLERKVNTPTWVDFGDGFEIEFFSGLCVNLGFLRINWGEFIDADELVEELGDP